MRRGFHFLIVTVIALSSQIRRAESRPLEIYWVDVGGGAATLIVTPQGESVLIDSGEDLDRDASRIHYVASQMAGLSQIDHVIVSHWHSDHFGGIPRLSKLLPLKRFYANRNIPQTLPEYPAPASEVTRISKMLDRYKALTKGVVQALKPGDRVPLQQTKEGPRIDLECVASDKRVLGVSKSTGATNEVCSRANRGPVDESDNARSLVLVLRFGKFTFLNTGDLTWNSEATLVCPHNVIGSVDLFQISHHGLDQSNNPVLIESIRPRVVVINNAQKKGAEPNTMKTLKGTKSVEAIWQVHRNIRTGPELNTAPQFIANAEENDQNIKAEFIKAVIQSDGRFSVQIGINGKAQTYLPR